MPAMRELDTVRMKRRQKEVEVKRAEDKVHNLKLELKELDDKIIFLSNNSGSSGGFNCPVL